MYGFDILLDNDAFFCNQIFILKKFTYVGLARGKKRGKDINGYMYKNSRKGEKMYSSLFSLNIIFLSFNLFFVVV